MWLSSKEDCYPGLPLAYDCLKEKGQIVLLFGIETSSKCKADFEICWWPTFFFFFFLRTGCAEKKQPLEIDAMTGCAKANWIMYLYQLYASVHPENSAVFYKQACCL